MRLYKTHKTRNDFQRVITLKEDYSERYCCYKQSGPNFVIDYVISLKANNEENVYIYCDIDEQTLAVIASISQGIDEVIQELNLSEITLKGIDILIEKGVYRPSDFKTNSYVFYTSKRLKEILFRNCLKYSRKPIKNKVEDQRISSEIIDRTKTNIANLYNDYELLKTIDLPNRNKETLYLPEYVLIQKEFLTYEAKESVTISVIANDFGYRHLNHISVSTNYDKDCAKAFSLVGEALEQLKSDCYSQGYNLGGMNIYINKANIGYVNHKSLDLATQVYWFLKDYLLQCNEVEII